MARRRTETSDQKAARLLKAAEEAIECAIATGKDPFEIMIEATGERASVCFAFVQKHPFFRAKRTQFKTRKDRRREIEAQRKTTLFDAALGPVVWVRRHFDDYRQAAYRLADLRGWHWSNISGGNRWRANRFYLHAYVMCDAMIAGELAHSCIHGEGPHKIKVCITKKGNEKLWPAIEGVAKAGEPPPQRRRRKRKPSWRNKQREKYRQRSAAKAAS